MMARGKKGRGGIDGLRQAAESRLGGAPPPSPATELADLQSVLHELEVHRVELELQNEELRSARSELEAGLARFTEIFDFAPIGYAILSEEGIIRDLNHVGAGLLGWPRSTLVGASFGRFLLGSYRATFNALLEGAWRGDVSARAEVAISGRGGEELELRLTATAPARTTASVLLAFEDITERKRRETQLARTEAALREADRRKDEFLAMLSHELRNPLAPIKSSLYVLARSPPGSEAALRAGRIVERQFAHLSRLVDDLLDVTRISRGKVNLRREPIELSRVVQQVIDDQRLSFDADGLELEAHLGDRPLWIDADPARITQVVSNLLGNAAKFTPRGGRIDVTLEPLGSNAVLRVRDNGAGIAAGLLQHIFEPFAQGPQTLDRARGGLGLGLAMVKGFVELHGGQVGIASEGDGRGTEVIVHLPLREAPRSSPEPSPPRSQSHRRIVVIDDSPDIGESLRDALALSGHEVRVAVDGPSGIALAHAFHPDVVLCDIGLPGMDGFAVARELRRDPELAEVSLIALSGYAQPEDRRRAVDAGFDEHVAKPPSLDHLNQLLEELPSTARDRGPRSAGAPFTTLAHD